MWTKTTTGVSTVNKKIVIILLATIILESNKDADTAMGTMLCHCTDLLNTDTKSQHRCLSSHRIRESLSYTFPFIILSTGGIFSLFLALAMK